MTISLRSLALSVVLIEMLLSVSDARAADDKIAVAEGKLVVTAPAGWQRKRPESGIVEHEFAIPKAEGDDADGRMTVMGAGGSVDANIDRWLGQFLNAEGEKLTKEKAKIEKKKIAGEDVVLVDIAGTYVDKPPFAPGSGTQRKNYRMLAGVVTTKQHGNYFFKFYGPEKTVEANEDAFVKMIESLEKK